MKKYLMLSLFLLATPVHAGTYETCQAKVTNASFGSSQWEQYCTEDFDMPNPYLIKCAAWVLNGFPSESEKTQCKMFCKVETNWGPWYDYEVSAVLKPIVFEMKRLHQHNRCFEG